jgi:hypothetical protein
MAWYDPSSWFGGGSEPEKPSNTQDGFDWSSLIQPAISSAWNIYSGKQEIDAKSNAANAASALQQQQFDAEMAYKYAALAARGGGGGGGGAGAALAREQLELQKKQVNDNNFFEREKLRLAGQNAKSEAYRSFVSGMIGSYK